MANASVKYCASGLFLSPNYFGDVIRQCLGQSPKDYIRQYITARAKNLLLSGKNIAQTAEELGFEYPQHFFCYRARCYPYRPLRRWRT